MRRTLTMVLGFALIALVATGCFQAVGAALLPTQLPAIDPQIAAATSTADALSTQQALALLDAQQTQQAFDLTATAASPMPTFTPLPPTDTPFMTPTDPNQTAFAPTPVLFMTSTPTSVGVAQVPTIFVPSTFTPQPSFTPQPTYTFLPTYTPFPTFTPPPDVQPALGTPSLFIATLDPNNAFAVTQAVSDINIINPGTDLSVAATAQAVAMVPTAPGAAGQPLQFAPTNTPEPLSADPNIAGTQIANQTSIARATQIIAGITATAAFFQTATSIAQGTAPVLVQPPGQVIPGVTATPAGLLGTPGSGAAGPITPEGIYTVVAGDRLFRIALRFGVPLRTLMAANGIVNDTIINPGLKLRIPGYGQPGVPTAAVPPAGAVTLIPGATLDPNATIIIITATPAGRTGGGTVYIVREGDTLYGIATRFRVSVTALAQYNGITNFNLIYIGQQLLIP